MVVFYRYDRKHRGMDSPRHEVQHESHTYRASTTQRLMKLTTHCRVTVGSPRSEHNCFAILKNADFAPTQVRLTSLAILLIQFLLCAERRFWPNGSAERAAPFYRWPNGHFCTWKESFLVRNLWNFSMLYLLFKIRL
jgi:hypothetical protein